MALDSAAISLSNVSLVEHISSASMRCGCKLSLLSLETYCLIGENNYFLMGGGALLALLVFYWYGKPWKCSLRPKRWKCVCRRRRKCPCCCLPNNRVVVVEAKELEIVEIKA